MRRIRSYSVRLRNDDRMSIRGKIEKAMPVQERLRKAACKRL